MNDEPIPGAAPAAPKNPEAVTLVIPLSALGDEGGSAPGPGDTVDISGEARVESVADGKATITLLKVNDSPVSRAGKTDSAKSGDDAAEADLEAQAAELDKQKYV